MEVSCSSQLYPICFVIYLEQTYQAVAFAKPNPVAVNFSTRSNTPVKKMKNHIEQAKFLWEGILEVGDVVVDATVGNGKDTLFLAQNVLSENRGFVYGYDIQRKALDFAQDYLQKHISISRIKLLEKSHIDFSDIEESIKLVVYNLGYLPGGDKSITTRVDTTIKSLFNALGKARYISITLYPGHHEGEREKRKILEMIQKLDPKMWSICHYEWPNREKCPSLLFIEKLLGFK